MHKRIQNCSSNGGPDAALEGALDGGLNAGFEWAPQSSLCKQLKVHNKVTKRMHLTFYLMTFALKYEHASAFEGAPDGSSECTPRFEVEIKGVLEVTIEMHLKMHMLVHLLVQKNSQNNSVKGGTLCCS